MNGQKLINKAGFWQSNDSWIVKPQQSMLYLENISKSKIASLIYDQGDWKVELKDQSVISRREYTYLWRKVETSIEDYFKLATKYNGSQFLTATSAHNLILDRGK